MAAEWFMAGRDPFRCAGAHIGLAVLRQKRLQQRCGRRAQGAERDEEPPDVKIRDHGSLDLAAVRRVNATSWRRYVAAWFRDRVNDVFYPSEAMAPRSPPPRGARGDPQTGRFHAAGCRRVALMKSGSRPVPRDPDRQREARQVS